MLYIILFWIIACDYLRFIASIQFQGKLQRLTINFFQLSCGEI